MDWKQGAWDNERVVRCGGCGSAIAVCEARVAADGRGNFVFSCSPMCEHVIEARLDERERVRVD